MDPADTEMVLVVDDEPGMRDTLVEILGAAGIAAEGVGSLGEAVARLEECRPAAVVVDHRLPDGTGLDLATRVKAGDPDLPVIVLTGYATLEAAMAAVSVADDYLAKPVAPELFVRMLRAALERRRLLVENRNLIGRLTEANQLLEARVAERTEALRLDRQRLNEAQRIARIGSWEWDVATGLFTCSDELYRVHGVEPRVPWTGPDALLARVHPADREAARAEMDRTVATARPFSVDYRVVLVDGPERWLRSRGRAEVDRTGAVVRLAGTAQDITDQRRAEEQFRELLESAPDAMVIVDGAGEVVLVNRASEALFGWPRSVLVGNPVSMLFSDRLRNDELRRIFGDDGPARGRSWATELCALRSDGTEFPVEISLGRLQTQRGPLVSAAVRDITDRKHAQARLAHQAVHDALTGLPNRTLLVDRLRQVLARRNPAGTHVAVLFVDLDRFKLLNDSRGHALGDGVLMAVAERLRRCIRPGDTVARFGGDEFVVVCEGLADGDEATLLGHRVAAAFDRPFPVAGGEVFMTVSVGIALAAPGVTAEGLLRDADAAMYRAKERGRARLELFDAGMRTEAAARLTMGSALHRALERDELKVEYQPVVDLGTGWLVGVEALLRWTHPDLGPVSPAVFVPMAEEAGLILPIGGFVLDEAMAQWRRWCTSHPGRRPLQLAINLSGRQLHDPSLVETIEEAMRRHRVDPACVCFELTESVLIDDLHLRAPSVLALKQLGVSLAIDDFGTGYSSLTYLKSLPVDILKIDQSFVAGLDRNLSDQAIVRSVVELAQALGLRVVGEGAENPAQADELRRLGCEQAQGYLFGRPMRPAGIDQLLADGPNVVLPGTAAAV